MQQRYVMTKNQLEAVFKKYTDKHGFTQEAFDSTLAHIIKHHKMQDADMKSLEAYMTIRKSWLNDAKDVANFIEGKILSERKR